MRLYVMQHGEAVDKHQDPDRPLTLKGRNDVGNVRDFLKSRLVQFSEIWHSPKTRCKETAEILKEKLDFRVSLVELTQLNPDTPVEPLLKLIDKKNRDVLVVGHLPQLSRLAGALLCDDEHKTPIIFTKGACAAFEHSDEEGWRLCWMILPDFL